MTTDQIVDAIAENLQRRGMDVGVSRELAKEAEQRCIFRQSGGGELLVKDPVSGRFLPETTSITESLSLVAGFVYQGQPLALQRGASREAYERAEKQRQSLAGGSKPASAYADPAIVAAKRRQAGYRL